MEKKNNCLGRLLNVDDSTFSDVYEAHWESLFKYIIRILPSTDDAADVVQETFVTFWELQDRIQELKSVKAYLFVMARNLAFRRFKEQLKRVEVEDRLVQFYGSNAIQLEQVVSAKELSNLLEAEIDRLPERMREVFVLSRREHLTYKEIAERLHISDQTVKKQISNSLKYLRLRIDDEYIPYLVALLMIDLISV